MKHAGFESLCNMLGAVDHLFSRYGWQYLMGCLTKQGQPYVGIKGVDKRGQNSFKSCLKIRKSIGSRMVIFRKQ
jgi:hypothetical protein